MGYASDRRLAALRKFYSENPGESPFRNGRLRCEEYPSYFGLLAERLEDVAPNEGHTDQGVLARAIVFARLNSGLVVRRNLDDEE